MHSFTFQMFIMGNFTMDVVGNFFFIIILMLCVLSQNVCILSKLWRSLKNFCDGNDMRLEEKLYSNEILLQQNTKDFQFFSLGKATLL